MADRKVCVGCGLTWAIDLERGEVSHDVPICDVFIESAKSLGAIYVDGLPREYVAETKGAKGDG